MITCSFLVSARKERKEADTRGALSCTEHLLRPYYRHLLSKSKQKVYVYDTLASVIDMELTLGEKIRLLREEKELNQTELGKAVNMTQRKVSYLESDKYEPSIDDLKALCTFFHVSADYLLGFPKSLPYPKRNRL